MSEQQPPRVRASDAEREQIAALIRQAMSEGRLSLAEGEERLASLYATNYRDELPSLTADLPPTTGARTGATGTREGNGRREGHGGRRRHRPSGPPGFALLAAAAAAVWLLTVGQPIWPAIMLGVVALVVLKRHWLGRYGGPCGTRPDARERADAAQP